MILITGSTGFLGAYITKNLIEKGHRVRAIRRSSNTPFFISSAIWDKVEWVDSDVLDTVGLEEAMQGVGAVIHAAAIVSFNKANRAEMYRANIQGTANVVNAALEAGVKRFLQISSVAALGRTTTAATITEDKTWEENNNNTHYAITKHHAEIEVWRGFAEGLEGVIINLSTILGFGNWHQSSCAIFKNGYKNFPWYTKGINGFVGVEDVAEAAVQLVVSTITGERFIVNAENRSFQWLFTTIANGLGKKPPHRYANAGMSNLAWRMEALKSFVSGTKPLLSKETAKIAHSQTAFDNAKILRFLPNFQFSPLETVINNACKHYVEAINTGQLSL